VAAITVEMESQAMNAELLRYTQRPSSARRSAGVGHNGQRLDQIDVGTLPQPWDTIGRHAALPPLPLDDRARIDGIAHLNHYLSQVLVPRMKQAYDQVGAVQFAKTHGHEPATLEDARSVLTKDVTYQAWSRLRRGAMELRQKIVSDALAPQQDQMAATCAELYTDAGNLELDPTLELPDYLNDVHAHLMPGGYVTDRTADDVSAGASYEIGLYSTVPGRSGPRSDGAGRALSAWLKGRFSDASPKRIFDFGCGAGLNTVAVAKAFPDAEIVGVDAGAPMLRYAAARAASLGVKNVRFVQANIEKPPASLGTADIVFTVITLHETSLDGLRAIFRSVREHTRDGGLSLHVEQPGYAGKPPFEQVLRDWDGRYNNESFWSELHHLDLLQEMVSAGFAADKLFDGTISAVPWQTDAKTPGKFEDYGRTGNWVVIGGVK
jgi:SAM-dependent methyltransferase